jgi:broad specificity phosphatase PhoE
MATVCTVYVIRHAESEANVGPDVITGHNLDGALTEKGIVQAQKLGKYFKQENIVFSKAYASTAKRAHETAKLSIEKMEADLELEVDELLLEQSPGDWVGKPRSIYKRPDVRQALDATGWNFVPGDEKKGESQKDVAIRMIGWLDKTVKMLPCDSKEQNIVVFTHGNAIKYLLAELFNRDRATAFKIPIDNTSITLLRCENGKWSLDEKAQNWRPHLV